MSLQQLPSEILLQVSLSLDRHAIWALCLTSVQFHHDFQPSLITAKGSLDRAYKWSAKHGDVALFRQVLQRGKYRNLSALCLAAKYGHVAIVDELLEDCEAMREALLTGATKENKSWGHPLATAVKAGHADVVHRLLELEGLDLDSLNRQEWYHTPLDRAVLSCNAAMLDAFVDRKVNLTPTRTLRPLPIAAALAKRRCNDARKLHASGGADGIPLDMWHEISDQIRYGDFPDRSMKEDTEREVLQLLYSFAPQLVVDDPDHLALAASLGLDTLRLVLQGNPDLSRLEFSWIITDIVSNQGNTYRATPQEKVEMCKLLIGCGVSIVGHEEDEGEPSYDIIERACDNFVSPELLTHLLTLSDGSSPTKALRKAKSTEIVQILLDRGADIHESDDKQNITALFAMLERGAYERNPDTLKWRRSTGQGEGYQDWRRSIELPIAHGADLSLIDRNGRTAMSTAVCGGADEDLLRWLMDHGAHMKPPEGHEGPYCDPLTHIAKVAKADRHRIVQWLLDHGLVLNNRTGSQATVAVCCDIDLKTIKVLLDQGFQLDEDESTIGTCLQVMGKDCYSYYEHQGKEHWPDHVEATRLLFDAGAKMFFNLEHDQEGRQQILSRVVNAEHFQMFLDRGIRADQDINWDTRGPGFRHISYQGIRRGTILHYAVERHWMSFVTTALDAGASLHAKNWLGHTPWELAKGLHGPDDCDCGFMEELGASPVNTLQENYQEQGSEQSGGS